VTVKIQITEHSKDQYSAIARMKYFIH